MCLTWADAEPAALHGLGFVWQCVKVTNTVGARLPRLRRDHLAPEQRGLYDDILGGPRGDGRQFFPLVDDDGSLTGPFNAMLFSPTIGSALQSLGSALRYRSSLPDGARELAILVVAAALDSEFEWCAHEPQARHYGISNELISAVRSGSPCSIADDVQLATYKLAVALVRSEEISDQDYKSLVETLSEKGVFEVSTLVGYYSLLASQMRLFQVGLPGAK
jgi:4-carboxymuconolactone decarboxylase